METTGQPDQPHQFSQPQDLGTPPKVVDAESTNSATLDAQPAASRLAELESMAKGAILAALDSPDLSKRARALRLAVQMAEGFQDKTEELNEDEALKKIGDTFFSPEEVRAGLMSVAADLPEEGASAELAQAISSKVGSGEEGAPTITIPVNQPRRTEEEQRQDGTEPFSPDEAFAATIMLTVGLDVSGKLEADEKLVKLDRNLWPESFYSSLQSILTDTDKVTGDIEAIITTTKAKIYKKLQRAIDKNNKELVRATRETREL